MPTPLRQTTTTIRNNQSFLVAAHYNPDGDAIGSTVAMGHMLAALGKDVMLYNISGMPERNDWLALPAPFTHELPDTLPEVVIVLDSGSTERMGADLEARLAETLVINIDHHIGNPMFGDINWVETTQPAVGSMMAVLARELDIPLTGDLAEAIYLAVSTDTGFFTYGNTTPESLEMAAEMLRNGLDMAKVNMLISKQWTLNRMQLWTEVMSTVEEKLDGAFTFAHITRDMFERTGTSSDDTEGIINFIRKLKQVRVAAILREEGTDMYKFSLRSYGTDNVQQIAATFGGGGHKNAAGGTIHAPLNEAKKLLAEAVSKGIEL